MKAAGPALRYVSMPSGAMRAIVDAASNGAATAVKILGLRYVLVMLVAVIPFIGGLLGVIDFLFIFRSDRRCVHDLIAGTKVVSNS